MVDRFFEDGWMLFPPEASVVDWAKHAALDAKRALHDPDMAKWYQCEGTWFVGLEALNNDSQGRVGGSRRLAGTAVEFAKKHCGGWPHLHRAQVSGVFPGYPKPRAGETEAAFRYRLKRDAAHVDGVLGIGQPKRRFVREPHAFIMGIPLTEFDATAAPLVVWEGSHRIMKDAFVRAFGENPSCEPEQLDITEVYQKARRHVFETCNRVVVHGAPGSVFLLHRLLLHGVAPWEDGAKSSPEGRLVAYFRPPISGGARVWAEAD